MDRHRYRIRFSKQGDLRMISHRDLLRTIERLFRRAELKLNMSEGFHPKPRMSFPSALALGTAGHEEVMELALDEDLPPDQLLARLQEHSVPGLDFVNVETIVPGVKKAQVESVTYEFPVPAQRSAEVAHAIQRFLATSSHLVTRPQRETPIEIRGHVECLQLVDDRIHMRLRTSREASVRPRDVLEVLGLIDLESDGHYLVRTGVHLAG